MLIEATPSFTTKQLEAISYLRENAKDFLRPSYDTDYNLLRWAQGYNFNLDEALSYLIRHLKFREFYDLDNIDKLRDDKILKQYFPLGLVGKTGKDNHLLVVECAGRIDLYGILRSVQLNVFLSQRFKFQENMLKEINKMESIHKTQCSVIYILDLEGLKLDSTLLTTVTGPYRILWTLVYTNYPEWVDRMIIVNSPTYISVLWKAISPLIPERTRNKVRIVSTQEDSINELKKCCDMKYVPKHWGGELIDNNGDPMCRDRLIIPTDTIPKSLYWQPTDCSPNNADLQQLNICAGKERIISVILNEYDANERVFLSLNRYAEKTYSMAIYHSVDKNEINQNIGDMHEWIPIFDYPAMPTTDLVKVPAIGAGIYKFRFGNEQAWFRSITIHYRIRFVNQHNQPVDYEVIS